MTVLHFAISRPVTVLVGVILVVMFGLLAIVTLPVQLTPDIDRPVISVRTFWEGASPQEVEREIVEEQEEQLKSVTGVRKMTSSAVRNSASVTLEFDVGTDTTRALLDVSDKLRQVRSYPENVEEPVVSAGETERANAIAWFVLERTDDSPLAPEDLPFFRTLIVEKVAPRMERAPGVARVGVFGGLEREVHVLVDPHALAARSLTLVDVRDVLRRRNVDVSAGNLEQGKRSYTIRTVGKFETLQEIEGVVLARRDGRTVYLADVAEVRLGYKDETVVVRQLGYPAIAVNATRQSGTNVLDVMVDLQRAVQDVNRDLLRPEGLELRQVYDETNYIDSAIDLVLQNLYVGGTLTILVLLLFLRHVRSVLIVAVAIPVSVLGAFLALTLLGRNLNVVSLAGLAFAVGMVVDNSIVVLENVFRHRQEGESASDAAWNGTREVWGAVLASTLTTLAVFLPVIFIEEEAGQLFRDISIAICAAVALSLLVSALFIPMATARLGRGVQVKGQLAGGRPRVNRFAIAVGALIGWLNRSLLRRLAVVAGLTGAAFLGSWLLVPPMTYLPDGNQNLVIGLLIPPPGYGTEEFQRVGKDVEAQLRPYWSVERSDELTPEQRTPPWYEGEDPIPGINSFFYVAFGGGVFMGARSVDDRNVLPLVKLLEHSAASIPGMMLFASQRSLFSRSISSGNSIDVEVVGDDLEEIRLAAGAMMQRLGAEIGPVRPSPPGFGLGAPEIRLRPEPARLAELGLSVRDLGFMVQAMVDGAIVSDYRDEGVTIDVKIRPLWGDEEQRLERLDQLPLVTDAERPVLLGHVAMLTRTEAPTEIRHVEEQRSVSLSITPPPEVELSRALDRMQKEILPSMRESGAVPGSIQTLLSGTADKLITFRDSVRWNLGLAVIITFLLLSALFESFLYPIVILFSVPLAAVGGIVGLRIAHTFTGQQLDVLTMLGFVILIGTVVNNAILIVHQGLANLREHGMEAGEAIVRSVEVRVRPIFMSTTTSVFGMAPLVFFPGSGSELYRGLGSVVIGGLLASTVFSLVVVPTLFSLVLGAHRRVSRWRLTVLHRPDQPPVPERDAAVV